MLRTRDKVYLLIFTVLAFGVLAFGLAFVGRTVLFKARATRTEGTVVEMKSYGYGRRRDGRSRGYLPVFEFKDAPGALHRVTERVSSGPAKFARGETVRVLYDPADPEDAHIDTALYLWFGPGFVTFLGTVLAVVMCFIWRSERRRTRRIRQLMKYETL